ncbi:DDE-type integrase/transposase/recombinase [Streptomyces sp. NPDC005500]|uniref:DDE-type integrase/transposase/recombinase n=1 Tax=Streptomyces sp. NPDC005500 TaxID=3155007 RepID=UPI0033B0E2BD
MRRHHVCPIEEDWLYLAAVIDIASRRVVCWQRPTARRTEPVADALTAACWQRRPTRAGLFIRIAAVKADSTGRRNTSTVEV